MLMSDPNSPRGKWPLARVTKVYPGADGLVRSVQVRTANSYLDRPVSKLCFLEETVDDCPVAESTEELNRGSSVGGAVDTPRDVEGKDELDSVGGAVDTLRDVGGKDELDRGSSVSGAVDTLRDVAGKDELDRGSSVGGAVDTPRDVEGKDELDRGSSVGGAVDIPRDVGGKDEDLGQMNAADKRPVRSRRAPKGHEDFVRY